MKTNTGEAKGLRAIVAIGLLLLFVLLPYLFFGSAIEHWSARHLTGASLSVSGAGVFLLALDVVLPVPSSVVATAMGAWLGAGAGTLVNAIGLTLGCVIGLAVGRGAAPAARRLLGGDGQAGFEAWVARYGIAALILCRPVPVLAEASVIALGAGRGRIGPLLAAALLADLALGAVYAFAGAARGPEALPGAPALAAAVLLPALAALFVWRMAARLAAPRPR